MNATFRFKLLMSRFFGVLDGPSTTTLQTAIESLSPGAFNFDGFTLITSGRRDHGSEMRAVVKERNNEDFQRGIAATRDGMNMVNSPIAKEVIRFIVEWNRITKEKHASRYAEARRNGHPRPRHGRHNSSNNRSNQRQSSTSRD